MVKINISGKEIPLLFNVGVWGDIEENICDLSELEANLNGKKRIATTLGLLWLMGNEGLKKEGHEPFLDMEWLRENTDPRDILTLKIAALEAIAKGMHMESADGKEKDLSLAKIQKKEESGN